MMLNDLLFIALFLTAGLCLVIAAVRRSPSMLRRVAFGTAGYFVVVIAVSLILPRREIKPGQRQCFDDMCIVVDRVESEGAGDSTKYDVTLSLSSRAKRIAQRENNLSVYVSDANGHRYGAVFEPGATPFNVLLGPGESAVFRRTFNVSANAPQPGLIVTREGGFPIGWFIVGYDTWFRKPPVLPLSVDAAQFHG